MRRAEPGATLAAYPLGPTDVQIWQADLDDPRWPVADLAALLAPDEHDRGARLRFPHLRRRFVVRRALLRLLLGAHLGRPAAALRFQTRGRGKPELRPDDAPGGMHFNVSDCDAAALYALTRIGPVGVDIEALTPIPDMEAVAGRWFSAAERAALASLPEEARVRGFYQAWTRKEALVKAEGTGVGLPLDRFSVSLGPGEPARLVGGELPLLRAFELHDVPVADPYVAACAVWRAGQGAPG